MSVLLAIFTVVLMVPVLLVVAIALGPAALVILFLIGWASFVLLVEGAALRHKRHRRVPPLHG
ncbi:MAG: hypothetical protein WBP81_08005 [Solirubrobacteraceae bacterium]